MSLRNLKLVELRGRHEFEKHMHAYADKEKLTLGKDGIWRADGEEITHERTCEAFFKFLRRDSSGYFIEIGNNTKRVEVEDTAYFVVALEGDPQSGYEAVLSDHTKVGLDPATLRYKPGRLTCRVVTQTGEAEARFLRTTYFEILQHLEEDEKSYFVDFGGSKIILAKK